MTAIVILVGLISILLAASWIFGIGNRDKRLNLDFTNLNWREQPKEIYREQYREGLISREDFEDLAAELDGIRVNY